MPHNQDPTAEERKKDHIQLAFQSQTSIELLDQRFYYEPCHAGNNPQFDLIKKSFIDFDFDAPIWVSSMTGGTKLAGVINKNLALMCNEFNLGMGLGSCRKLLYDDEYFPDFDQRKNIGDRPLYANLGIAQVEQMINEGSTQKIKELLNRLEANGLIIHINPLQEYMQPEGDRYQIPPIDTIRRMLDLLPVDYIIKEVGHGMGPKSIEALMNLPIKAIEFAAFGGTNFSVLELSRSKDVVSKSRANLSMVGHTAYEMIDFVNSYIDNASCKNIIISGGIKNYLDGYYFISRSRANSIYGMASGFLEYAMQDYNHLKEYAQSQIEGYALANQLLTIKK